MKRNTILLTTKKTNPLHKVIALTINTPIVIKELHSGSQAKVELITFPFDNRRFVRRTEVAKQNKALQDDVQKELQSYRIKLNSQKCGERVTITPYAQNRDLHEFMNNNEVIPTNMLVCMALKLFFALQKLAKCNISHRDIKAENILIDHNFEVWLTDFFLHTNLSPTAERAGTYYSPIMFKNYSPLMFEEKIAPIFEDAWAVAATILETIDNVHPENHFQSLVYCTQECKNAHFGDITDKDENFDIYDESLIKEDYDDIDSYISESCRLLCLKIIYSIYNAKEFNEINKAYLEDMLFSIKGNIKEIVTPLIESEENEIIRFLERNENIYNWLGLTPKKPRPDTPCTAPSTRAHSPIPNLHLLDKSSNRPQKKRRTEK